MISVIIPTLNSARTIRECLESVKRGSTEDTEIIVEDGGSTDETVEIAKKYTPHVYVESTYLPGVNRNKGVQRAKGEIVCFTDSDCIVPDGWVEWLRSNLVRLHERDSQVVGVGGGNIPWLKEDARWTEKAISATVRSPLVTFNARSTSCYQNERLVIHNPPMNSAYFKSDILSVGGFGERYKCGEDWELDLRLGERGKRLYYLPSLTVKHMHRTSVKSFLKQMNAYGRAHVRVGIEYRTPLVTCYGPLLLFGTFPTGIPILLALVNALWSSRKKPALFPGIFALSILFYIVCGLGALSWFFRKEHEQHTVSPASI